MQPTTVLRGATVHTGAATLTDTALVLVGGAVAALVPERAAPRRSDRVVELDGLHLAPGFVDLQVNGGGGVMLNDEPTPEAVARIAAAHRRFGTTALLPTYITGPREGMRAAAEAVHAARRADRASGVLGVHFEGPFLDPRKPGAHAVEHLRRPDDTLLSTITEAARDGAGVLLTLAACCADADTVARLRSAGVRLSLGHCGGTAAEAATAFARGVTSVTHLFNAMTPLTSREGGVVAAALDAAARGDVRCGLILDGVHVAYDVARVALRAAGPGGVYLVTDAVAPVGAELDSADFQLGGQRVRVEAGRCINESGALAGSALDMRTAVANAVRHLGLPLDEALRMAATYPAELLGVRKGRLEPGYDADVVIFDDELDLHSTIVGGELP